MWRKSDLCGAAPGRALGVSPEWHPELVAGMVPIPEVQPGDTVFWHTDICHAVGDDHAGNEYASVIYIGSAPDCPKNRAYLPKQKEAFLAGRSAPDFAAMDFEVDFVWSATTSDLTRLAWLMDADSMERSAAQNTQSPWPPNLLYPNRAVQLSGFTTARPTSCRSSNAIAVGTISSSPISFVTKRSMSGTARSPPSRPQISRRNGIGLLAELAPSRLTPRRMNG